MSTAPSIGFDTLIQPLNEAGFPAAHFPPSSEQPFDFLRVLLDSEADEPGRFLEINPVPGLKDMHVLQCLVPLPVELRPERADVLARYLLDLNAECIVSGFGFRADLKLLYFRTMIPQSINGIDPALLVEVTWTIAYMVDRFLPLIQEVAAGDHSLEEAKQRLKEHIATPYVPSS